MQWRGHRLIIVAALCVTATALSAPVAQAGAGRACKPIVNPYAGTRYDGSDLRRIRAVGLSCRTARRVVRGAHRKALGITPHPVESGRSGGAGGR